MAYKQYAFVEQNGPLPFTFKNDLMFKLVLQGNEEVLRGLLCSLLHLKREQIVRTEILNPYLLGQTATEKTCVLVLDGSRLINLEMQVVKEQDWIDRSVYYLCRMHDQLERGDDYRQARPTLHIGIIAFDLDFSPEENVNEFYAEHVLMNKKTHKIYSSKIGLNVLNLSHAEDASEEQRASGLYGWAKLFNATTWEELRSMAEKEYVYAEAAEALYEHSLNKNEAMDLLSREMALMDQMVRERRWREGEQRWKESEQRWKEGERRLKESEQRVQEIEQRAQESEQRAQESEQRVEESEQHLKLANERLGQVNGMLAEKETELAEKETELQDAQKKMAEYEARLRAAGLL